MVETNRGDARVVNRSALNPGAECQRLQLLQISFAFGEQGDVGQRCQPAKLLQRKLDRRWRLENARVGDDGEEFVDTGPGNRPWRGALRQRFDQPARLCMELRVRPMGLDEQIGVNRDHRRSRRESSPTRPAEIRR